MKKPYGARRSEMCSKEQGYYQPQGGVMLRMDGFDCCIAGVCRRCGSEDIVCYDIDKVLAKLVADSEGEMTLDDAREFFEFNQIGAWMGDSTPCFIELRGEGE